VELRQLKEFYYEPGLLRKALRGERLRDVISLQGTRLYPEVEEPLDLKGTSLTIRLKNRGGGIGPVRVFVNGALFKADVRPPGLDPGAPRATIPVDLSTCRNLM